MPLVVEAPRPLSPGLVVAPAPAVAETRAPGVAAGGSGRGPVGKTAVGADGFPGGNAATGAMLSRSPPGVAVSPAQMLAGQSVVGNAAGISRVLSRPPMPTPPKPPPLPDTTRAKPSPAVRTPAVGPAERVDEHTASVASIAAAAAPLATHHETGQHEPSQV